MADSEENINPTVNLGRPFAWELELEARATRRRTGEDVGRLDMLRKAWTAYKRDPEAKGDMDAELTGSITNRGSNPPSGGDTFPWHGDPSRISETERRELARLGFDLAEAQERLTGVIGRVTAFIESLQEPGERGITKGRRKGGKK